MTRTSILAGILIGMIAAATSSCAVPDFLKDYVDVPPYRLLGTWQRGDNAISFTVFPDGRVLKKSSIGVRYDMGTWEPETGSFSPHFPSSFKRNGLQFGLGGAEPGGTTISETTMANGDPDDWGRDASQTYKLVDESARIPEQENKTKQRQEKAEVSYTYIDTKGNTVAPGPFLYASTFKNGAARVQWRNNVFVDSAINKHGQYLPLLSVPRFRTPGGLMSAFGESEINRNCIMTALASDLVSLDVQLHLNDDGQLSDEAVCFGDKVCPSKLGFIGKDGKVLIERKYDYADNFHEGLALVVVDDDYRYIRPDGKFAFDRKFQFADSFSENLAPFIENDLWGYIDRTGATVIKPQFSYAGKFHDGLAAVRQDNCYSFIDKSGKVRTKTEFYGAKTFADGLIPVLSKNGLWGYADKDGSLVITPRFKIANPFSEGRAAVCDTVIGAETPMQKDVRLASMSYVTGQALAGAAQPLEARKQLEKAALSKDPVLAQKAKEYIKLRMLDFADADSVNAYNKVIEASSENYEKAEALALKAISDYPEFYQLHLALANTFFKQRKFADGDKLLHSVIAKRPDYARAYVLLSTSADEQGDRANAIKYAKLAVEKDPLDYWVQKNKVKLLGY